MTITLICVGLISTISDSFSCVRCRRSRASLILFPNHILFIVFLHVHKCSKTVHPHQTDGRFFNIVGSQSLLFKGMDLLSQNRTLYHKSCHQGNTKDDKHDGNRTHLFFFFLLLEFHLRDRFIHSQRHLKSLEESIAILQCTRGLSAVL